MSLRDVVVAQDWDDRDAVQLFVNEQQDLIFKDVLCPPKVRREDMSQRWFEQAEDQLVRELNEGRITQFEYNKELRELQREYRDAAQEAAHDAYEREMGNW